MILDPETILRARIGAYAAGAGTHLPLLASVVAIARPGPVLEIGTGHCSAPLLAEMCKAMGRLWCCIDSEQDWIENVRDLEPHSAFAEPDLLKVQPGEASWSVVFVDCAGPARLHMVQIMRPLAEFIVVHDTDNQGGDLAELLEYFKTFPHRYDYTRMRPWTTVVSDVRAYPGAR